ncbi:MAG: prepilin-type N-terminal cleavage/methylation domain-containing protein [Candidatus Komeilibacteria bacterium]|nr:prepilin-type N-terminal cleavage/methylation domain-containing protein [Candidatus Komeilibacteria bacterium]
MIISFKNINSGFSLFEILISITIGAMLLGLVLSIYTLTMRSVSSSEKHSELTANSRIIIERLARDIRQARQIATPLPTIPTDPQLAPPSQLEMLDGHDTTLVRYVRYYLANTDLKRQIREYYFPSDPSILVTFNAVDDFGNPASLRLIEDQLVGQYVKQLSFYGQNLITIELGLEKDSATHQTIASFYGRNL